MIELNHHFHIRIRTSVLIFTVHCVTVHSRILSLPVCLLLTPVVSEPASLSQAASLAFVRFSLSIQRDCSHFLLAHSPHFSSQYRTSALISFPIARCVLQFSCFSFTCMLSQFTCLPSCLPLSLFCLCSLNKGEMVWTSQSVWVVLLSSVKTWPMTLKALVTTWVVSDFYFFFHLQTVFGHCQLASLACCRAAWDSPMHHTDKATWSALYILAAFQMRYFCQYTAGWHRVGTVVVGCRVHFVSYLSVTNNWHGCPTFSVWLRTRKTSHCPKEWDMMVRIRLKLNNEGWQREIKYNPSIIMAEELIHRLQNTDIYMYIYATVLTLYGFHFWRCSEM